MEKAQIGKTIRKLREEMKLSQAEIGRFLGIDQSLLSKIEADERTLSSDMLDKLSCLFGVPVVDIISGQAQECKLSFAFRKNELTVDDLETISAINRIALNAAFMHRILKDGDSRNG